MKLARKSRVTSDLEHFIPNRSHRQIRITWDFSIETVTCSTTSTVPPPPSTQCDWSQTSIDDSAGVKEASFCGWEERVNERERRLSRQRERNTCKQQRGDKEEMKGKRGMGLRANDGKDFNAPALMIHANQRKNKKTNQKNKQKKKITEWQRNNFFLNFDYFIYTALLMSQSCFTEILLGCRLYIPNVQASGDNVEENLLRNQTQKKHLTEETRSLFSAKLVQWWLEHSRDLRLKASRGANTFRLPSMEKIVKYREKKFDHF